MKKTRTSKFLLKLLLLIILISSFLFFANYVLAANPAPKAQITLEVPIFEYKEAVGLAEYIKKLYQYSLYALVPIAIVIIIWAGFLWIMAGGDQSRIKRAKTYITGALTGVIIGLLSYVILSFVGITTLNMPGIESIEQQPIPILEGEFAQPDTFNNAPPSGAPPVAGNMPRIFQCDYRSVAYDCGNSNICNGGCGVVSLTMVLRYYGKNVSVPQVAQYMLDHNYRVCGRGTSPTGFKNFGALNGLKYQKVAISSDTIKNYVANKKPIIANVGNRGPGRTCKYTGAGHFIVISGWDAPNNRFIINDPGGRAANRYNGTWADLTQGCEFKGAYYVGN